MGKALFSFPKLLQCGLDYNWEEIDSAIELNGLENFFWLRQIFNAKASPKSGSILEFWSTS